MNSIRNAAPEDCDAAVDLLMQAAGALLTHIFGNGDAASARRFLASAWQNGEGQYGYQNHWVAESEQRVVGLITSWHDNLAADFDRKTLDIITAHFGLDEALTIVMRSQAYSSSLHPPTSSQLAIGHLAVTPDQRRQGTGRLLLNEMLNLARRYKKNMLVLDVEADNQGAIDFYIANHFTCEQTCPPFQQMVRTT